MSVASNLRKFGGVAEPSAKGQASGRMISAFEATPDVACLQQPIVNLYFVGERGAGDRSWTLIDAGLPLLAESIINEAEARYGPGSRPSAIVLTHGHFDHVGALPRLAEHWDVPAYAHPLELPYLTGRSSYPPPDPAVGGGAMSFLSRFYPRGPIDLGDRARPLPADGSVPGMPGWRWIATPGHSPGHVSFLRDADRALIAGDAFVTTKQESALGAVLQAPTRVRRPPAYFTQDWGAARRSVEVLARLEPELALTGHGLPLRGEALRAGLDDLIRRWGAVARPSYGRYADEPAVFDERGVLRVPPPVVDPHLVALAGIGLAAGLGWLLLRDRPSGRRAS